MSIAFDRATGIDYSSIQRSTAQLIHGGRHGGLSACNRAKRSVDLTAVSPMKGDENHRDDDVDDGECSDSDDSSIGRNSDVSSVDGGGGGDEDDEQDLSEIEVQSAALKSPLDTMDDLHDVLPIRKGISMHYSGKSKSFTSLADAVSSSSIKEIAKPMNPYNKKRKNDLLHGLKNRNQKLPPRVSSDCGIFKRMTNGNCSSGSSHTNLSNLNAESSYPPICLPPRPPQLKISPANEQTSSFLSPRQNNLSYRSYSHSDLRNFGPGLVIDSRLT